MRGGSNLGTENVAVTIKLDVQLRILDAEHEKPDFLIVGTGGEENDGVWAMGVGEELNAVVEEIGGSGVVLGVRGKERGDGRSG